MELKPGMLGQVRISSQRHQSYPFVPEIAVQKYGKEFFVFIDKDNGLYQKRPIELKEQVSDGYLVAEGLQIGDKIVNQGSFTLKAEMLKSVLGGEK